MIQIATGLSEKRTPDGIPVLRCHYSADPERGQEWATAERKKYTSEGDWQREQEIIHEAGGGERLFAHFLDRWPHKILVDPLKFQIPPGWKRIGGFDHGKANPTATLMGCLDFDGNLWLYAEYYMPGLGPAQHRPNLLALNGFVQTGEVLADPNIFYATEAQSDGTFKAIAMMYAEIGITNLMSAPDNTEITGMERIASHWLDLDNREPSLRILCPMELRDIQEPVYGICNNGCPNLLWELRRTRRAELTATQLMVKNPTEKIVDKDNHLRDCLKYIVLSLPEPARMTPQMKALEAIKDIPKSDPTSRVIFYNKALEENQPKPITLGRRGAYLARRGKRF
jgi:hypothetical protein